MLVVLFSLATQMLVDGDACLTTTALYVDNITFDFTESAVADFIEVSLKPK